MNTTRATWRIFFSVLIIALGVFFFIYGGYDDSPGGQLLGAVVAAYGAWRLWRGKRVIR